MSESKLIPSIDNRLGALLEVSRRQNALRLEEPQLKPTVTISREFGCEAYPMAELLRQQLEKRTKESWTLMDKNGAGGVGNDIVIPVFYEYRENVPYF